ncbi:4848_t:CDS:2 [Funneliformis caledonium]|uniref:4848_t:CDS:1 n=1 Tax=Funneliformis caledonium TaxID=1117310 RepID=A0A9N9ARG7_9GLOM|nr:4848_t:CDS:2 [Funneliformis caledonium]
MQEFLLVNPSGPPRKAVLLVESDEQKSVETPQQNNDPKNHDDEIHQNNLRKIIKINKLQIKNHQDKQAQAANNDQRSHDKHAQKQTSVQRQEVQDQVVNKDQRYGDDHTTKNIADQRKDIQAQFGVPNTNQALDANAFAALQALAIAQQDISQITST